MDLNIVIEDAGVRDLEDIINEKLSKCIQLGFHTVALSIVVDSTDHKGKLNIPDPPDMGQLNMRNLKVMTRLTVKVSHTDSLYKLNKHPNTSKYELLALEARNFDILQYLASGNTQFDILTFDLSDRIDNKVFKARYKLLEQKDICIELNYGAAQMGSSMRRNTICNGQNLVEKTNKTLILSNGIQDKFRLRGPLDAKSLGTLFMIPQKRCHDTVYKNGLKAIQSAKRRLNPISSAIELVDCE